MQHSQRASGELDRFIGSFPQFDEDTGEPVDNPGWYVVNLDRGWDESPEDRAQDRVLARLEAEQIERALLAFPEDDREAARAWLTEF